LLGLAMGIPPKDLGVSRHLVPVDSIIRLTEKKRAEAAKGQGGLG
jgi:heterodisulfide reductase subunit B